MGGWLHHHQQAWEDCGLEVPMVQPRSSSTWLALGVRESEKPSLVISTLEALAVLVALPQDTLAKLPYQLSELL